MTNVMRFGAMIMGATIAGTASAQDSMIAFAGEFCAHRAANSGAGPNHKTYRFHFQASKSSFLELWELNDASVNTGGG